MDSIKQMMMQIVEDVYLLSGFPNYMINMYLVGDVLVDAGIKWDKKRILNALNGHQVSAHALTHVHPDHQGSTHGICDTRNIPLWCPEDEIGAMETGDFSEQIPRNLITTFQHQFWTGEPHPVEKGLREGDCVGGFDVINTPGHSPGHISLWRERDQTLIVGDVARNINFLTLQTELLEPPAMFTVDSDKNRESLLKLANLKPKTVLFGHGKPLMDGAKFTDFAHKVINS